MAAAEAIYGHMLGWRQLGNLHGFRVTRWKLSAAQLDDLADKLERTSKHSKEQVVGLLRGGQPILGARVVLK